MSLYQDYLDQNQKTFSTTRAVCSRDSTRYLKYCTKCRLVWEKGSRAYGGNKNTLYYEDFPTIGKERKTCEKCK